MNIIGLDLATIMGWARTNEGRLERSGVRRLKRGDDAAPDSWGALGLWLRDELEYAPCDGVFVEAPMEIGAMIDWQKTKEDGEPHFRSTPETMKMLIGLAAIPFAICRCYDVRCRMANVQTVRKHFVGQARPKGDAKAVVLARCHELGLMPEEKTNTNESDAIAIASYGLSVFYPRERPFGLLRSLLAGT